MLLKFPTENGPPINIPQRIGTNYYNFGVLLLKDETGAIVDGIVEKQRDNANSINTMIIKEWLQGKGVEPHPVTWETLVKVLRDADLSTLAGDIEQEL